MAERFSYVGSVYLLLIKENKILLLRRFQTGFEDGKYGLPAGHMDGDETAREACAREVKEEIGIDVHVDDLHVVHVMHRKTSKDERIDFFITTRAYSGVIQNCEPMKCDDLSWFELEHLPENMVEYVRIAIEHYQKNTFYSEYGW